MDESLNVGGPRETGLRINDPRIIVHGGMYTGMFNDVEEYMKALKNAAIAGHTILRNNGTAVDAVEKAVYTLEENANFNAGHGSFLNEKNDVECDAMIMEGHTLKAGAVAAVRNVPHPISLSKTILRQSQHCILCGQGAFEFAVRNEIELGLVQGREYLPTDQERIGVEPMDTVSAIAMDCNGHLACATSSGGMPGKAQGRIGDVPLIGCGGYANEYGAATTSGHGELIMKMTVAREVVYNIEKRGQDAQYAVDDAVREVGLKLEQRQDMQPPYVGVIAMDSAGNFGIAAHGSEPIPWARISGNLLEHGQKPGPPDGQEIVPIRNDDA